MKALTTLNTNNKQNKPDKCCTWTNSKRKTTPCQPEWISRYVTHHRRSGPLRSAGTGKGRDGWHHLRPDEQPVMDKVHPAHTSRPLITVAGAAGVRAGGNRLHLTSLAVGTDHRQCHHWQVGTSQVARYVEFLRCGFPWLL